MVRNVKSATTTTPAAPTTTPAAASTVTKPRAKKVKAEPVAATEQSSTVATDAAVSTDAPAAVEVSSINTRMTEFNAKLQQLVSLFSAVKNDFKSLEKLVSREMKIAQKASSRKRKTNGNRKPSGFIKPTLISDELAAFLGKEKGVEMARTDVSKEINAYIQSNSLQDKANGRKIHPDAKLAVLLKIQPNSEEELTYFNLQRYMKHHFIKTEAPAATATA
uniref:DM2 domain-containing protein n=1 Tax=viral metagenome TaxID=1070528 RepID=A0A6C0I382_9ZZZZ